MHFLFSHSKSVITAIVLIVLGCAWQLPQIQIDTDPENMLVQHHPDRVFHNQIKQTFALKDVIVLGISVDKALFEPAYLADIDAVSKFILANPHVVHRDVLSLSTVDNIKHIDSGTLRFEWLMKEAPDSPAKAIQIREAALNIPLFKNTLVSGDGKASIIFIPVTDKQKSYEIAQVLREFISQLPSAPHWYITGLPIAENQFGVEMFVQMAISAPLAGLTILGLMWLFFRSISLILAPMFVAIATVIITMGALIGMGFTVHIMSSMIAIFLMPIAVVDGVHVLSEFSEKYDGNSDVKYTIALVLKDLFKPMLLTSVTSSAGFLSLLLTPIPPVQIFGAFIGLGILVAFALTLVIIPIYINSMSAPSLQALHRIHTNKGAIQHLCSVIGNLAMNHKSVWVGLAVFVCAMAIVGMTKIQVNDNPVRWFKSNHEIRIADAKLNEQFSGTYNAYLVISHTGKRQSVAQLMPTNPPAKLKPWIASLAEDISLPSLLNEIEDQLFLNSIETEQWLLEFAHTVEQAIGSQQIMLQPDVLKYIDTLEQALEEQAFVGKANSVIDIVKLMNREIVSGNQSDYRLPLRRDAIAQLLLQYQSSHRPQDLWHYVTPDYRQTLLWLQMTSGDNKTMSSVKAFVEDYTKTNPLPKALKLQWAGKSYLNLVWQENMVGGMLESLIGAFAVVFVVMLLLLRSVQLAVIAMLPLSISILGIYGLIGFIGKDYDMPIAVLSALTLGLSVDFAIHFLVRAKSHLEQSKDIQATLEYMFTEPSTAIVRNALVVAFGFVPLLFAPLVPYITVGFFLAAIMLISALVTLLILPVCLHWLHHKTTRRYEGLNYETH